MIVQCRSVISQMNEILKYSCHCFCCPASDYADTEYLYNNKTSPITSEGLNCSIEIMFQQKEEQT